MTRFRLSTLLFSVTILAVLLGLTLRFPGPMILLASFVPVMLVVRYIRPGKGAGAEIKLIAIIAFAAIPPYLAAGPAMYSRYT